MTIFAVERSLPGITMEALSGAQAAAISASEVCNSGGIPMRYLRTLYLPMAQRSFCLFEAESEAAVRHVNDAAGLPYTAIAEAMDLPAPLLSSPR